MKYKKKILVVKKFMLAMAINPKINTNSGLNKFIYEGNVNEKIHEVINIWKSYVNSGGKNYLKERSSRGSKSPTPHSPHNFSNGLSLIVTETGGESAEVL